MDKVICDLCNGSTIQYLFQKDGFHIHRCHECNLVFVHPQDSEENLKQRYGSRDYFCTRYVQKYGYGDYASGQHLLNAWFSNRLNTVESLISRKGKMLDIGCAMGFFLKLAREHGWETRGVDYSKYAVDFAQERFQLDVSYGRFEETNLPKNYFDIVTLFDVIEHVRSPSFVFREIHKLLVDGGYLVITTPNCAGLLRKIMRRYWFHFKPLEHTFFFSPDTISAYLKKTGFEVVKIENCKKIVDIDFLVNRAFHYNPHVPKIAQYILGKGSWKHYPFPFPTGEINIYARKI